MRRKSKSKTKVKARKKRKASRRRPATRRSAPKKRKAKKRVYATSWHKYTAEIAARARRAGIREHGSLSAWRKAKKRRRSVTLDESRADQVAWRSAFTARHGRAPSDSDWLTDFNYTWRERYGSHRARAAANPPPSRRQPKHRSRLEKLQALADDPGAMPGERDSARRRIIEMS